MQEVCELPGGPGVTTDQEERVTSDDLTENHQVAVRLLVVGQQEPNGPTPGNVPPPAAQGLRRLGGTRGHHPLYLQTLGLIGFECKSRIEGRVKNRPEVF